MNLKHLNRRVRMLGQMPWEKFKLIWSIKPWSMINYPRLSRLYDLMREVDKNNVPGSIVVCGAWEGGSGALLSGASPDRYTVLLDSFEGMPAPGENDVTIRGRKGKAGTIKASHKRAGDVMWKHGARCINFRIEKGWFADTIPNMKTVTKKLDHIAFVHLDCDWEEPTRFCLEELWDSVSPGGIIAIDDYGYWEGCKKAVDEFCYPRSIRVVLSEESMAYIRK